MRSLFRWFRGAFPVRRFADEEAGPAMLAIGVYWQDGDAAAFPPTEGQGWLLTTNLDDGLVGDTSTREDSTGATITVLHVHAPYIIGEWAGESKYDGGHTEKVYEWDGAAWDEVAIVSGEPPDRLSYDNQSWTMILTGVANSSAHMIRLTTESPGSGVMSMSDSRPSA